MLLSRRFGYDEISNWLKSEGQQLSYVKASQFLSFLKFHIFYYFLLADSFMKFYMLALTNIWRKLDWLTPNVSCDLYILMTRMKYHKYAKVGLQKVIPPTVVILNTIRRFESFTCSLQ